MHRSATNGSMSAWEGTRQNFFVFFEKKGENEREGSRVNDHTVHRSMRHRVGATAACSNFCCTDHSATSKTPRRRREWLEAVPDKSVRDGRYAQRPATCAARESRRTPRPASAQKRWACEQAHSSHCFAPGHEWLEWGRIRARPSDAPLTCRRARRGMRLNNE